MRSISLRLSILFAATSLAVFTLVGVGLFAVMRYQLTAELRATLDTRADVARLLTAHVSSAEKWPLVQEKLMNLSQPGGKPLFYVDSADPRFRFGKPFVGTLASSSWDDPRYQLIRLEGHRYNMITTSLDVPANGERPPLHIVVAGDCERNERIIQGFGIAVAVLIAAATGLVLLLSRSVTRFGLAPLRRLSKEASQLSPVNRRQRLHTDALATELHDLSTSFNGALERIDRAYERLESFNADVAHELRTPVSILIGQTEVALSRDRSVSQLQHTLQSNLEELERLRTIVNDMLFLSRRDRGERATGQVDVSLAAEVLRTLEFLEISFEDAQLRAELQGDVRASVNTSMFGRALTNLLVNAIQHSRPGMTVTVTIKQAGDYVAIAVSNPGEPLDSLVREHIFDRFYRLEESRVNSKENHGLGLSIVKAIAEMHDGTVFVESAGGINTFGFLVATTQPPVTEEVRRTIPTGFATRATASHAPS
jgi:two-component system, OmpR family, heavy metal sensor histidine kinase CusS